MAAASVPFSSLLWDAANLGADALRLRARRTGTMLMSLRRLRRRALTRGADDHGIRGRAVSAEVFRDERTVQIGTHHTVAGNADRFATGDVTVRSDDRWLREMSDRSIDVS